MGSLLARSQMPISQLKHLIALWAFAAGLHCASGHLLLLYKMLLCMRIKNGKSAFMGMSCVSLYKCNSQTHPEAAS